MDLPWKAISLTSVTGAFALTQLTPEYSIFGSFILTLIVLLVAGIFLGFVWQAILWPKLFSPLRHLPKPSGGSFLNGQFARIVEEPSGSPHQEWINSIPNDGLIYYTTVMNRERLFITNTQALGQVLTQDSYEYVKPAIIRHGLGRVLGVGLILAEGDEHKTQRKNLMPAFAYRHVKDLYPVFWSKSCEMVNALMAAIEEPGKEPGASEEDAKDTTDRSVVEIGGWGSRAALDIIGLAGMGHDFGAIQDPDTELNRTYRKVFQPTRSGRFLGVLSMFLPQFIVRAIPATHNNNIMEATNTIKRIARGLIRQKQAKLDSNEKRTEVDILSVALESGGFSEDSLVNQMMTFLAAGHETTATTMTWACYALCKHPEMQTRLREEIRQNIPPIDEASVLTAEKLDKCHYLHAVCNEVLRLHAPVPITLRETIRATHVAGQYVPKGTTIILSISAVNTHISQWGEDAGEFIPDRWMKPGEAKSGGSKSNYSFMTFIHGPRSCIGQAFAKAEFACLLAALVGSFELELARPDEELKIQGGVTNKPKHGMHIKLKAVDGW